MAKVENGPTQLNIPRDYFYGEADYDIYPSLDVTRGPGSLANIEAAADLLINAKYPVILSGGGVSQSDSIAEVQAIAEYMTTPVVNTYLHNDTFPRDHQLAVGAIGYCGSKAAMRTINKADVIIALGTRLGPFGTLPQYGEEYWPKDAKIVQVDINHKVLGLTQKVDVACLADVKEFSVELLKALKARKPNAEPVQATLDDVKQENAKWAEEKDEWSSSTNKLMHPRRFLKELAEVIPQDAIVTTDIGNNSSMTNDYFHFNSSRKHLAALSWGNCGFAYGAAMGAKMAAPNSPVFAFQGDGAYGISGLSEVMTAVRENIPVIAIVANNHEWGAEKKNQVDFYGDRYVGSNLHENPDYAQLARDMGAVGIRVEDYGDVQDAVREAVTSGRPAVIEGVIEGGANVLADPFRRDALKKPQRLLEKYKSTNID